MNEMGVATAVGSEVVLESVVYVGQLIEQAMEEAVRAHGLSIAKISVLHVLVQQEEPLPLGSLSRELHCVKSNITQLIDRLEADRLVRRVPDAEDRRSVRAEITEEGRQRYNGAWPALQAARQDMLAGLAPQDQEQLLRLMLRLRESRAH